MVKDLASPHAKPLVRLHKIFFEKLQRLGPGIACGTWLVVIIFIDKGMANAGIDDFF